MYRCTQSLALRPGTLQRSHVTKSTLQVDTRTHTPGCNRLPSVGRSHRGRELLEGSLRTASRFDHQHPPPTPATIFPPKTRAVEQQQRRGGGGTSRAFCSDDVQSSSSAAAAAASGAATAEREGEALEAAAGVGAAAAAAAAAAGGGGAVAAAGAALADISVLTVDITPLPSCARNVLTLATTSSGERVPACA